MRKLPRKSATQRKKDVGVGGGVLRPELFAGMSMWHSNRQPIGEQPNNQHNQSLPEFMLIERIQQVAMKRDELSLSAESRHPSGTPFHVRASDCSRQIWQKRDDESVGRTYRPIRKFWLDTAARKASRERSQPFKSESHPSRALTVLELGCSARPR